MLVLAQEAAGSSLTSFLPIILIGVFFYFVMLRPQRRRQRERTQMMENLTVGADVVTVGGMHGRVDALGDGWVDLLVTEDVVLRFTRASISNIVTPTSDILVAGDGDAEGSDELDGTRDLSSGDGSDRSTDELSDPESPRRTDA